MGGFVFSFIWLIQVSATYHTMAFIVADLFEILNTEKCILSDYGKSIKPITYKNEKSEDYSKADLKQRVLLFITIFRLAIPAFLRFTDVTELM